MNNPLSDLIQRGGDVLQQQWPTVDPKYLDVPELVELCVLVGTTPRSHIRATCDEIYSGGKRK